MNIRNMFAAAGTIVIAAAWTVSAGAAPVQVWEFSDDGGGPVLSDCRNCEEQRAVLVTCSPGTQQMTLVSLPGAALRSGRRGNPVNVSIRIGRLFSTTIRAHLDHQGLIGYPPEFELPLNDQLFDALARGTALKITVAGETIKIPLTGSAKAVNAFRAGCSAVVDSGENSDEVQTRNASKARKTITKCVNRKITLRRDRSVCIGKFADRCLRRRSTQSTLDRVNCARAELAAWDEMLNTEYDGLLNALDSPDKKQELRAAQRAWLDFRDKYCRLPFVFNDGGTMAQPMTAYCRMTQTARQALNLRTWGKELAAR